MLNMSNSKKALIASIAVLAVFAFAASPIMHAQNALAFPHDGFFGHHHGFFDDFDDCDDDFF